MGSFKRAVSDTVSGQLVALFTISFGGFLGLIYLYVDQGADEARSEVPYWEAAVFGALGSLAVLFLLNWACAPYRMQKEETDRLILENKRLETALGLEGHRSLSEEQIALLSDKLRKSEDFWQIDVLYRTTSNEVMNLAGALSDAVKRAKIRGAVRRPAFDDFDPRERGIKILWAGKIEPAEYLQKCLGEVGLESELMEERVSTSPMILISRLD